MATAESINALKSGTVLHERYTVKEAISQGGFGIIYVCVDNKLKAPCCIKELFLSSICKRGKNNKVLIPREYGSDFKGLVKKFNSDNSKLSTITHPNICNALDFFEANNTSYLVMEYIQGDTLQDYVRVHGGLGLELGHLLLKALVHAVDFLHQKDIIHKDIKPENILLRDGTPILIDFGSAQFPISTNTHLVDPLKTYLIGVGDTLGSDKLRAVSPGYSAHELYALDRVEASADVYSLGATTYFMLSGRTPIETSLRLNGVEMPKLDIETDHVTSKVANVVDKSMSLKGRDRYRTVREFETAFTSAMQEAPIKRWLITLNTWILRQLTWHLVIRLASVGIMSYFIFMIWQTVTNPNGNIMYVRGQIVGQDSTQINAQEPIEPLPPNFRVERVEAGGPTRIKQDIQSETRPKSNRPNTNLTSSGGNAGNRKIDNTTPSVPVSIPATPKRKEGFISQARSWWYKKKEQINQAQAKKDAKVQTKKK
jgi:serine/threonine protein kinase